MVARKSSVEVRQRNCRAVSGHRGILVEASRQRSRRSEPDCQDEAGSHVNPKKITCQNMTEFFALDDRLCKAVQPEVHQKQAESSNHSYQPEIPRSEQSCQYHGGDDLDG